MPPRTPTPEHLLADLALESADPAVFRSRFFGWLDRTIGFDVASSAHTRNGRDYVVDATSGVDLRRARARMGTWLQELHAQEFALSLSDAPVLDREVVSAQRRDRLSMYRELWHPLGQRTLLLAVWKGRAGAFAVIVGRSGGFRASERARLERALPVLRLSEALWAGGQQPVVESGERSARDYGLTPREREVAALVARGLRNAEIAQVLGSSALTVRNQLGSIFRKVEVSTRAELVGALLGGDEPVVRPAGPVGLG